MAIGPGKYDKLAEHCIVEAEADAVILIVVNGKQGGGMSMKIDLGDSTFEVAVRRLEILEKLPRMLRHVADSIERDANHQA